MSRHDCKKFFEASHKKLISGQKTAFLDPKRATLGNRGHKTACQAAKQTPTRKPKLSRVTSRYGGLMIQLGPSDPKKWGLYGCSVKNEIFGPKMGPGSRPDAPCVTGLTQKPCHFGAPSWWWPIWMILAKNGFWAQKSFLFYATLI